MKEYKVKTITLIIGVLSIFPVGAQTFEHLDINNINARINANSYLFHNPDSSSSSYEFPANSGINSIFSARLNLASTDVNGQVIGHIPFTGVVGPHAGPIMNPSDYATSGPAWDKVWKIDCSTIETFKEWYSCSEDANCDASANFPGYQIPQSILEWPAHGVSALGQSSQIAPFFDTDGDDFYDPNVGDYPLIKGNQAIFFIYNAKRTQSILPSVQIEFRGLAYAYGNTGDSALDNTIFIDYEVINRSTATLANAQLGFDVDFDLGNASDDFIASDVARSAFYAYNGDSNDEDGPGSLGYGANLAAQGVVFLNGGFQDNDGLDNPLTQNIQNAIDSAGSPYPNLGIGYGDGIVDNEQFGLTNFLAYSNNTGLTGQAVSAINYYHQTNGKWNDGTSMVWGGTGHLSSGGTVNSNMLFPGDSDPLLWSTQGINTPTSNWSEVSEANPQGDRKGVGSVGPVTLEPGQVQKLTIALVSARDYSSSGPQAAVNIMKERIDSIHSYFRTGILTECIPSISTGIQDEKAKENNLLIYPSPFNNQFTLNYSLENNTAILAIYNVVGKIIKTQTVTQNSTVVDLSKQPSGFYFITITDGDKKMSQKIIKQ